MNKVTLGKEAKEKLLAGINIVAEAVTTSLGPSGKNTIFKDEYGTIKNTKDGVSISDSIKQLEDPVEDFGAQIIKQAAKRTVKECGDGTTTTVLLTQSIVKNGYRLIMSHHNPAAVKKGIDKALNVVINELESQSKSIETKDQIKQVATISANNDPDIGFLIAEAMDKVGVEGIVTVEESRIGETSLEVVEGIQFNRGFRSPYFVTDNNKMSAILDKPKILIYDGKITQVKPLLGLLESLSNDNHSLLVVAEDIDGEALATLVINKSRGSLKVAAVKAPEYGDRRLQFMEDLAVITGGTVVTAQKGMRLEEFDLDWLGECRLATVQKEVTTIVDGKGSEESIAQRAMQIKNQIDSSDSAYETEKLQERLSKLAGGVAIISIGGASDIEIKEKKDRAEDALHAAKSAIEDGVSPGGGVALLKAKKALRSKRVDLETQEEIIGFDIIEQALESPIIKILSNAGYTDSEIWKIQNNIQSGDQYWNGYNVKTSEWVDLYQDGVLDPTKTIKTALTNAVSTAGTILLTDCIITEDKKEEPSMNMSGMDFGGM
jgi:chaperonin GroEL